MRLSAGLLVYRHSSTKDVEVLLVHPGGPFWANRDEHGWSIPKGELDGDEDPLIAAGREFSEELGHEPPEAEWIDLGEFRQSSSKTIRVWAVEGDLDVAEISSNTFEMEWPPRSGLQRSFPEVDRAEWFDRSAAAWKIHKGQVPVLDALDQLLRANSA